jgi:hypothetical protein
MIEQQRATNILIGAGIVFWFCCVVGLCSGCDQAGDVPDAGDAGRAVDTLSIDGGQTDACAPKCRLGADGVGCLCLGDFGDVYCRDVAPAGLYWHDCCGRACR